MIKLIDIYFMCNIIFYVNFIINQIIFPIVHFCNWIFSILRSKVRKKILTGKYDLLPNIAKTQKTVSAVYSRKAIDFLKIKK